MPDNDSLFKSILESLQDGVYYCDRKRKITFWNKGAEAITGYSKEDMVGKFCANILQHIDEAGGEACIGKCPLEDTMTDAVARDTVLYLCHKDGHRVPVWVRATPIRDDGGEVVGVAETFNELSPRTPLERKIKELQRMALLDQTTMTASRRYMEMSLRSRLNDLQMFSWPFGVMAIYINDLGWPKEDYVLQDRILKTVARTLLYNIRGTDILGRWGEKEFMCIILNAGDEEMEATERKLGALVSKSSFTAADGSQRLVSVSTGYTTARAGDTAGSLLERVMQRQFEDIVGDVLDDMKVRERQTTVPLETVLMIEDMYAEHERMGYYKALGVDEDAPEEEIEEAYKTASGKWHPASFPNVTDDLRGKLEKILAYLKEAHNTLISSRKKKKYDRSIKMRTGPAVRFGMAEEQFIVGWDRLRSGDTGEAVEYFAEAVSIKPLPKYLYYYGMSLSKLGRYKEAEKSLKEALEGEPENPDYLAEIGHVYLMLGLKLRAKANFEKAIRIQPEHAKAKRELLQIAG